MGWMITLGVNDSEFHSDCESLQGDLSLTVKEYIMKKIKNCSPVKSLPQPLNFMYHRYLEENMSHSAYFVLKSTNEI